MKPAARGIRGVVRTGSPRLSIQKFSVNQRLRSPPGAASARFDAGADLWHTYEKHLRGVARKAFEVRGVLMKKKKIAAKAQKVSETSSAGCADYQNCLEQADICCEQARMAARLKRFKAAYGLFSTAQALYRRATALGGDACTEAKERLHHITVEMAAYGELAKSVARPVRPRAAMPARITPTARPRSRSGVWRTSH
jgi:hypothetical protein